MKTKRGESANFILCDGIKFYRERSSGYYINQLKERLHVYVWEKHNGKVPHGYDVHHINGSKDDNSIENLQALPSFEHHHGHGIKRDRDELLKNLDRARISASEWHKSEEGREWHKSQWERSIGKAMYLVEKKCEVCGKTYSVVHTCAYKSRFCSSTCRATFRRLSGVDDITVVCPQCGKKFTTNKHSRRYYCSDECYLIFKRSNQNIIIAS